MADYWVLLPLFHTILSYNYKEINTLTHYFRRFSIFETYYINIWEGPDPLDPPSPFPVNPTLNIRNFEKNPQKRVLARRIKKTLYVPIHLRQYLRRQRRPHNMKSIFDLFEIMYCVAWQPAIRTYDCNEPTQCTSFIKHCFLSQHTYFTQHNYII